MELIANNKTYSRFKLVVLIATVLLKVINDIYYKEKNKKKLRRIYYGFYKYSLNTNFCEFRC